MMSKPLVVFAAMVGQVASLQVASRAPARHSGVKMQAAPAAVVEGALTDDIWAMSPPVRVQGNTLRTWDIGETSTKRVQLSIKSDGRPIDTNVELWWTPSYIPAKFRVYTEDGAKRPVHAVIETPKNPKTIAVFNTAQMEFPFDATVANTGLGSAYESLAGEPGQLVQGNSITSYTFGHEVESVQVLLKTTERNMKAKIELTQGPNQVKQIVEVYASKYENPFYITIATPGQDNTIRVINQNTVEFPFDAWVLPYEMNEDDGMGAVIGGAGWGR